MRIGDELYVPASHASLPGHFPGDAIVPGVVLLSLVLEHLQPRFGPFSVTGLRSVKFLRPLRPGEPFSLDAEELATGVLRILCRSGETLLAEGSVLVEKRARVGGAP